MQVVHKPPGSAGTSEMLNPSLFYVSRKDCPAVSFGRKRFPRDPEGLQKAELRAGCIELAAGPGSSRSKHGYALPGRVRWGHFSRLAPGN